MKKNLITVGESYEATFIPYFTDRREGALSLRVTVLPDSERPEWESKSNVPVSFERGYTRWADGDRVHVTEVVSQTIRPAQIARLWSEKEAEDAARAVEYERLAADAAERRAQRDFEFLANFGDLADRLTAALPEASLSEGFPSWGAEATEPLANLSFGRISTGTYSKLLVSLVSIDAKFLDEVPSSTQFTRTFAAVAAGVPDPRADEIAYSEMLRSLTRSDVELVVSVVERIVAQVRAAAAV